MRECSDDGVGDAGVGRGHDAEMCQSVIERAVSVAMKLSCIGRGYIFRSMNE